MDYVILMQVDHALGGFSKLSHMSSGSIKTTKPMNRLPTCIHRRAAPPDAPWYIYSKLSAQIEVLTLLCAHVLMSRFLIHSETFLRH